ncbi:MAG: multiprotein-bridging factor 1 family protein [Bacteroidota bacterium]
MGEEPNELTTLSPTKIYDFLGYIPRDGNATDLAEKIKQYRIHKGLSLRRLAKELGIDPGTLGSWEKGERKPTARFKSLLARHGLT